MTKDFLKDFLKIIVVTAVIFVVILSVYGLIDYLSSLSFTDISYELRSRANAIMNPKMYEKSFVQQTSFYVFIIPGILILLVLIIACIMPQRKKDENKSIWTGTTDDDVSIYWTSGREEFYRNEAISAFSFPIGLIFFGLCYFLFL